MTICAPILGLRGKGLSDVQVLELDWQELTNGWAPDSLIFNFLNRDQDFNNYLGVISSIFYSFGGLRRYVIGNFQLGQVNNDGILAGFKDLYSLGLPMLVTLFHEFYTRTGRVAQERCAYACVSGAVNRNPDAGLRERGMVLMDTTDALGAKAKAFARHALDAGWDPARCIFLFCGNETEEGLSRVMAEEGAGGITVKRAVTLPDAIGHLFALRSARGGKKRRHSILFAVLAALIAAAAACAFLVPRVFTATEDATGAAGGPYWNDVPSLQRIWPQSAALVAESERLVPFLYPLEHPEWIDVRYLPAGSGPGRVLSIRYTADAKGNYGGWGIIFKGLPVSFRRFTTIRFHVKAKKGCTFQFKLKDDEGAEVVTAVMIETDGWSSVVSALPRGVDMDGIVNFSFGFNEKLGSSDIRIDELAFIE